MSSVKTGSVIKQQYYLLKQENSFSFFNENLCCILVNDILILISQEQTSIVSNYNKLSNYWSGIHFQQSLGICEIFGSAKWSQYNRNIPWSYRLPNKTIIEGETIFF